MNKILDLDKILYSIGKELEKATIKDWIIFCFILIIGIAISCFAINQALDAIYNINVMTDPCGFCKELNPNVKIINVQSIFNLTLEVER